MFMPRHHRHQEAVVCPKPRRLGLSSRFSQQTENSDSKAGSELLGIILAKGGHGFERLVTDTTTIDTEGASLSPFLCGSPPSRVSNPLIQDARFQEERLLPSNMTNNKRAFVPSTTPNCGAGSASSTTSTTAKKGGGCVRASFGDNPAMRIEGFNYLDRDHSRNCSIPALA